MFRKAFSCFLALVVVLTCVPSSFVFAADGDIGSVTGTTYYVSQEANASDENIGTAGAPFATIAKGASVLIPGDILIIKEGIYNDYIRLRDKGSNDSYPITIKGEGNVVIDTGYHSDDLWRDCIASIRDCKNIDISNITFKRTATSAEFYPIAIYGGSNIRIHNCIIYGLSYGNIRLEAGATNCIFDSNIISGGDNAFYTPGGMSGNIVSNNIISCYYGLNFENGSIDSNIFCNNTFNVSQYPFRGGNLKNNVVVNNIFSCALSTNSIDNTNMFDYNCYNVASADSAGKTLSATEFVADPLFTDAGSGNYTLQSTSPCIAAGGSEFVPKTDFAGKVRRIPADIGAFAYGNVYFVSKESTASDETGDGSEAKPFATLLKASSMLNPGDSLIIKAGNYSDQILINGKGSAEGIAPITVKNYENDAVTVTGANAVYVSNSFRVNISGITVDGGGQDLEQSSVVLYNAVNTKIHDCVVANAYTGLKLDGNSDGCEIFRNTFTGSNKDFYLQTSKNNLIYNNIFTSWQNIYNWSGTITGNVFTNNVFNAPGGAAMIINDAAHTTFSSNKVKNNIFNGPLNIADEAIIANDFDYNCYVLGIFSELPATAVGADKHNVIGDPAFIDVSNGDFHISRTSVCLDKGVKESETPDFDKDGTRRYGATDIGAYEFIKPNFTVASVTPIGDGLKVNTDTTITVTFDSPILDTIATPEVIGTYIELYKGSEKVSGTYTISDDKKTITFTPISALTAGTTYTGKVISTIKNQDNDSMDADYIWTFATASEWANNTSHPTLFFKAGAELDALKASTLDDSPTPYDTSTKKIWDRVKAHADELAAEEGYNDELGRGSNVSCYYYFYYPYMLQPVPHGAGYSLSVNGASSYTLADAEKLPENTTDYYINFDFKTKNNTSTGDYIVWKGSDGTSANGVIIKQNGAKLYCTNGNETTFKEIDKLDLRNDYWYNILIYINGGSYEIYVSGNKLATGATFGSNVNLAKIEGIGENTSGLTAIYDNFRLYNSYKPTYYATFDTKTSTEGWTGAAVLSAADQSHDNAGISFMPYWTFIGSDLQGRLQDLSLAYTMTDDVKYLDKAKQLMFSIANWDKWNDPQDPSGPASLDCAYLTTGMSLAYDMLYNSLTAEEKALISKAIKEKGIDALYASAMDPSKIGYYDGTGSIDNITLVQSSAMGIASLAVADTYETVKPLERAREILDSAYRNGCDSDGGWAESFIYGDLTIINSLPFHDADKRVTGRNAMGSGYLNKIIDFVIYNQFPGGLYYSNISDNGEYSYQYKKILEYYAKNGLNDDAAWALQKLGSLKYSSDMLSFLYNPGNMAVIKTPTKDLGKLFNDMGWASFKTGWNNDDTMAILKSSDKITHTHYDQNSIELVRGTSQLLCDPGYANYSSQGRYDFSYGSKGHNTMLIDDQNQSEFILHRGQIENFFIGDKYGYSVANAGLCYQVDPNTGGANSYHDNMPEWRRSLVNMIEGKYFILNDDYQTDKDNRNLVWQVNTKGQAEIIDASTVVAKLNNDSLGIKFINKDDSSTIRTEENLYAGASSSISQKGLILTIPDTDVAKSSSYQLTIEYMAEQGADIIQNISDTGRFRLDRFEGDVAFPECSIKTITVTLNQNDPYYDYYSDKDGINIKLDINDLVYIKSMTVKENGNTVYTVNAGDANADQIVASQASVCFDPGIWRVAFELNGNTVRGNQQSGKISMNLPNGKQNQNLITLLYPSGNGAIPETQYLGDVDDSGVVVSRDGKTDVVLFHKDSTEPVVLTDAAHAIAIASIATATDRNNTVIIRYKAAVSCNLLQTIGSEDIVIGKIIGDNTWRVDSFNLKASGTSADLKFSKEVEVSDVWSASTEKILTPVQSDANYTLQIKNPNKYYDFVVSYSDAENAKVIQDGVVVGILNGSGTQIVQLQKPYNGETVNGAAVNIQISGMVTVSSAVVKENGKRQRIGKVLDVGGDNDTLYVIDNVPGMSVVTKDSGSAADDGKWSAKQTINGVSFREGQAGAALFANSMNRRNTFRVYLKYKSSTDVAVNEYCSASASKEIANLKSAGEWMVASFPLKQFNYDYNGWNRAVNSRIEFGSTISVADAWIELENSDMQVDYNDVGKAGDNAVGSHTPGVSIDEGFADSLNGMREAAAAGSKLMVNLTDTNANYYVNVIYKASDAGNLLQTVGSEDKIIADINGGSKWYVLRCKLNGNYTDALTDDDGTVANVALKFSVPVTVSDIWLDKEVRYEKDNLDEVSAYNTVIEILEDFEPMKFTSYKAKTPVTIDGKLDEAGWDLNLDFNYGLADGVDVRAKAGVMWDENNIYIGFDVKDGELFQGISENGDPAVLYGDGVEVYVSKVRGKTSYDSNTAQYCFGYENEPYIGGGTDKSKVVLDGVKHVLTSTTEGYIYEISIPWAAIGGMTVAEGDKIGFNLHVFDKDAGKDQMTIGLNEQFMVGDWHIPLYWPELTLAGGNPDVTVAKTNSITLDGSLTEDIWANKIALTKRIIGSTTEIDAKFATTWDNANMYIGVDVSGIAGKTDFSNDSITYYLSPYNFRGTPYSANDFQVQIFDNGTRVIPGAKGVGKNDTLNVSAIQVKYKPKENGYTMEIAMPWSVAGTMPKEGSNIMGFDIMAFSNIESCVMEWSGGNWIDTTNFGTLTFACDGTEDVEITASKPVFEPGETISLDYNGAFIDDQIAIYPGDYTTTGSSAILSKVTGAAAGNMTFAPADFSGSSMEEYKSGLTIGNYVAVILQNGTGKVIGSTPFEVKVINISTDKAVYNSYAKEGITVSYKDTSANDWIGIYKQGETPSGGTPSIVWKYTKDGTGTQANGAYTFTKVDFLASTHGEYNGLDIDYLCPGNYKAVLLKDDSYTVIDEYPFSVVAPELSLSTTTYSTDFNITVNYKNTLTSKDWIGIYKKGTTPSGNNADASYAYRYATVGSGSVSFTQQDVIDYAWGPVADRGKPLPEGDYEFILMYNDGYDVMDRIEFKLSAPALNAPAEVKYNRTATKAGYADGTVTITEPEVTANITNYVLYWGDANGKLAGYNAIATLGTGVKTYTMVNNTYIPENATRMLAYSSNGTRESTEFASFDIPQNARISTSGLINKFQVISDIHVTSWDSNLNTRFGNALKDIAATAPDSAGIFIVGDNVDTCQDATYDNFFSIIDANQTGLPDIYYAIGNHEYFETVSNPYLSTNNTLTCAEKADKFLQKTGAPGLYYDKYINNQHFIVLGSDQTELVDDDAYISDEQFTWLENKLAETKNKKVPIFLFLHQSMADTVAGSIGGKPGQGWNGLKPEQDAKLRSILSKYPQVIMFNGHSHWDIESAHEMYDGADKEPSIFNTGAVCMLWTDAQQSKEGSQGFYVETYNDKVLVRGRDFENGKWIPSASFIVDLGEKYSSITTTIPTTDPSESGNSNNNNNNSNINGSIVVLKPELKQNGIAEVQVVLEDLSKAFEAAAADSNGVKTAVIELAAVKGASEYVQKLPTNAVSSETAENKIEIKTPVGNITVPSNMFAPTDVKDAQGVGLGIGLADKTALSEEMKEKIGERPVVELYVTANGKKISWNNPEAPVTVSIDYTPTDEELKDPDHIVVWYIDGNNNAVSVPSGRYNPASGKITFTTTHFSKYAVAFVHKTFNDTAAYGWAKKQIEVLASKGIINGTSHTTYAPGENISRADFIILLVKGLGLTAKVDSNFSDVSKKDYYYEAVGIARKLGITTGVGGNRFNPKASITRQDMMVMVDKALKITGKLSIIGDASDLAGYSDADKIASYAQASVANLIKDGIILGSGTCINPLGNATRAEVAVLVYRIYNK